MFQEMSREFLCGYGHLIRIQKCNKPFSQLDKNWALINNLWQDLIDRTSV